LVAAGVGWRLLWLAAGSISVLLSALVTVLMASVPAGKLAMASCHYKVSPGFRSLLIANALASFGYVITATFLVAMVRRQPELRSLEAWIWVVFGLATAPSVAAWTWIASHKSIPCALALAYFVEATGVLVSVLWPTQEGMLFAAVFVGATFMANTALGMMLARALCSGDLRRPVALMTAAFGVGQIAGPAFAGALHDAFGSFLLPSLIAACGILVGATLVARVKAAQL
jgi:predicted MFS family arabinose efflux permease